MKIKIPHTFTSMILTLFIGLKLCEVINWSWFWVLSPVTVPLCLFSFILLLKLIVFLYDLRKRK
jgi:hypothetical protein